jgi:hypothetical protein
MIWCRLGRQRKAAHPWQGERPNGFSGDRDIDENLSKKQGLNLVNEGASLVDTDSSPTYLWLALLRADRPFVAGHFNPGQYGLRWRGRMSASRPRPSRRKSNFLQSDIKRMIRGAIDAGRNPSGIVLTKQGPKLEFGDATRPSSNE